MFVHFQFIDCIQASKTFKAVFICREYLDKKKYLFNMNLRNGFCGGSKNLQAVPQKHRGRDQSVSPGHLEPSVTSTLGAQKRSIQTSCELGRAAAGRQTQDLATGFRRHAATLLPFVSAG